jgi:hypothetical protein
MFRLFGPGGLCRTRTILIRDVLLRLGDWRAQPIARIADNMVGKPFTIVGAVLVTLASPCVAQSYGVSARAIARATILRPALLKTSGQIAQFDTASVTSRTIPSQRLVRSCATDQTSPCTLPDFTLIVFDLP